MGNNENKFVFTKPRQIPLFREDDEGRLLEYKN